MAPCEEFESRLNELLDERRAPLADAVLADAGLAAHANVCSSCAALARGYEALTDGVAAWERVEPSADLTTRVIAQWELAKAQAAAAYGELAGSTEWDSAELPALRSFARPGRVEVSSRSRGFLSLNGGRALAAAALATAAMLLVTAGVNRSRQSQSDHAPAVASATSGAESNSVDEQSVAQVATASQPVATQVTLANLPIVGQMTETYRPLLEETDRTVRKSFGLPATSGGGSAAAAATNGASLAENEGSEATADDPVWDAYLPDQVAPVTQTAVRSVVALLRVLPGVDQPLQQ